MQNPSVAEHVAIGVLGLMPWQFWRLCPYELALLVERHNREMNYREEKDKADTVRALWAAWHVAAFERQKEIPKLPDLMDGLMKQLNDPGPAVDPKPQPTDQELIGRAKALGLTGPWDK